MDTLLNYLRELKVEIRTSSEVQNIVRKDNMLEKIVLSDNTEIIAKNFIICTGGKSFSNTGSTGDGYGWAKELGHTIIEPAPALTSIILKADFTKDLQGLSFTDVGIYLLKDRKKIKSTRGDIIFTDNGISGPAIMDLSRLIAHEKLSAITVCIDFFPSLDFDSLDKKLQEDFQKDSNRLFKNCLGGLAPQRLIAVAARLADIGPLKKLNAVKKEERKKLVHILKEFDLQVKALSGFDRAYITSGGISLEEIEPASMRSKLIKNLYFAGELLDLDGPTGGYNLQVCWTSGFVAGDSASLK